MKRRYRVKKGNLLLTLLITLLVVGLSINFALKASANDAPHQDAIPAWQDIVVTTGDSLWILAEKYAPQSDPREFIRITLEVNSLESVNLAPGQVLTVPHLDGSAAVSGTGII